MDLWGDDAAFCQITLTSCFTKVLYSACILVKAAASGGRQTLS